MPLQCSAVSLLIGQREGSGGTEPLAKAVQLKTDNTGSVVQTEFASPQLDLIALKRESAEMYSKVGVKFDDNSTVLIMTLQPNDNVAVTGVDVVKDMFTA